MTKPFIEEQLYYGPFYLRLCFEKDSVSAC